MKYLDASILLAIPAILGINSSLWAEKIHQIDDIPQESVKHFEKGDANTFIKGWDDNEVVRLAKLLGVPTVDVNDKLEAIFKDVEMFYTKYFGDISKRNIKYSQFRIDNEEDLKKFINETFTIVKINSSMFVFDDPDIDTGKQLPPSSSLIEIFTGEKISNTGDGMTVSILEPGYMGLPVDKFSQQYIIYGVAYGIAQTQSPIMIRLLEQWGNHLPPTVGDIIVFRGVHHGLRAASIEMQSATKTEDEAIKMDIKLVDWKILASAKNPIYRFLAIYSPYDNFQYTNEELLEFYQAYANETDPEIRKYVMGGLQAILEDEEGKYKDIYNPAKRLYDELGKKWKKR